MFSAGLRSVDWVSKITLTKSIEDEIRTCFDYTTIEFNYPDDLEDFDVLLETFRRDSIDGVDEHHVLGLADKSNNCNNFLTVSRKFG